MKKKNMLGIEIGSCRLKLAVSKNGKAEQVVIADLPENLVQNNEIVSWDAMAEFIKETVKANKISVKNVSMVLPEKLVHTKRVEMPMMTVEQLRVNLPYEFHEYITTGKDRYFYDYAIIETKTDENGKAVAMDLIAVATEKEIIEKYRTMCRRAGLRLVTAAPGYEPLKWIINRYEKRQNRDRAKDYAILDLGHKHTELFFFDKGEYEITRVMDMGLEQIDRYIAEKCNVGEHTARMMKETHKDDVLNDEGCMELYSQMAVEIMRVLNFYSFNNPDNTLDTVYCCGGGAFIEPLVAAVSAMMDIRVTDIGELIL